MIASASKGNMDAANAAWEPPSVIPESCFPGLFFHLMNQGLNGEAADLLEAQKSPHPEIASGWWLSASFWLAPIRGWIA